AVLQGAGMDLGHGGRRQWLALQAAEKFTHRPLQFLLDDGKGGGLIERWHPVLQAGQVFDGFQRQQIMAGGQQLAKLDEYWSQLFHRHAQAGPGMFGGGGAPGGRVQTDDQREDAGGRVTGQQLVEPVAGKHGPDGEQAGESFQGCTSSWVEAGARRARSRCRRASRRSVSSRSSSTSSRKRLNWVGVITTLRSSARK